MMGCTEDPDCIRRMVAENYSFVDDLRDTSKITVQLKKKYKAMIVCGMGASGICGELLSMVVPEKCGIMITSSHTSAVPAWANDDCLIIISSYSGNTIETINMYFESREKGLDIIVITSGGKLEEMAEELGDTLIMVRPGMQPRCSLGCFLGAVIAIVNCQCGKIDIDSVLPELERYRDELTPEDDVILSLIKDIADKTPVIYGSPELASAAIRWKHQISENSKIISFSGMIPEYNHNEVVGWYNELSDRFCFIVIREKQSSDIVNKTSNASVRVLKDRQYCVDVVDIDGNSKLERIIKACMLGDYLSIRLAAVFRRDPYNIEPIVDVKKYLIK